MGNSGCTWGEAAGRLCGVGEPGKGPGGPETNSDSGAYQLCRCTMNAAFECPSDPGGGVSLL